MSFLASQIAEKSRVIFAAILLVGVVRAGSAGIEIGWLIGRFNEYKTYIL